MGIFRQFHSILNLDQIEKHFVRHTKSKQGGKQEEQEA